MSSQQDRVKRIRNVMVFLPLTIGVLLWLNIQFVDIYFGLNPSAVVLLALFLILQSVAALLLYYLRGDINLTFFDRLESVATIKDVSSLGSQNAIDEIEALRAEVADLSKSTRSIEEGDQSEILEALRHSLSSDLAEELEQRFAESSVREFKTRQNRQIYLEATRRIVEEISDLSRRANLNLVIGVLTTTVAIGLLVYMILGADKEPQSLTEILAFYIPRISVAVFIEVFSFFFLKLYRSNLDEIKYYQNELVKLSKHRISFETAMLSKDESLLANFVAGCFDASPPSPVESGIDISELNKTLESLTAIVKGLSKST